MKAGASVVLWGKAGTRRTGTGADIAARISFVGIEGAFEGGSENVRGSFGLAESPLDDVELTGELALIQQVLPPLLVGYRLYRAASVGNDDYARPLALFDAALSKLKGHTAASPTNHIRAVIATLNLYRGNVYFLRRDSSRAAQAYQESIEASTQTLDQALGGSSSR